MTVNEHSAPCFAVESTTRIQSVIADQLRSSGCFENVHQLMFSECPGGGLMRNTAIRNAVSLNIPNDRHKRYAVLWSIRHEETCSRITTRIQW